MIKALAFILFREALPIEFCRLNHDEGAHNIGLSKSEGIFDGAVDMAFGSKVDDTVH